MRLNKLVFSSIAALALSTSAFGASYSLDLAEGKLWSDQVKADSSAEGVKLSSLG